MMLTLLGIFSVCLFGMIALPLRRLSEVRRVTREEGLPDNDSLVSKRVLTIMEYAEEWYNHRAKEMFLKLLDYVLKIFERSAGKIAGQIKHTRLMVQERFRIIPRESLYWKNIHSWKRETSPSLRKHFADDQDEDVSNHLVL